MLSKVLYGPIPLRVSLVLLSPQPSLVEPREFVQRSCPFHHLAYLYAAVGVDAYLATSTTYTSTSHQEGHARERVHGGNNELDRTVLFDNVELLAAAEPTRL